MPNHNISSSKTFQIDTSYWKRDIAPRKKPKSKGKHRNKIELCVVSFFPVGWSKGAWLRVFENFEASAVGGIRMKCFIVMVNVLLAVVIEAI